MGQLQTNNHNIFNFQGYNVRTITKDGEPWFILKDVCDALGIINSRDVATALPEHTVDSIDASHFSGNSWSGNKLNIVNESGLYLVIFKSRKETAVQFQLWVTSKVLPSIRKTGSYGKNNLESLMKNPRELATALLDYADQIERLEIENEEQSSKLQLLTKQSHHFTSTQVGQEIGVSANKLNAVLKRMKYIYYQSGTWIGTAKIKNKGYLTIKESIAENGKPFYHSYWTEAGRLWLLENKEWFL